jgi:hypothetical protein
MLITRGPLREESVMAFTLPPLPYDYKALEPHIDEQTMRLHHDKHHAAYVNNLNAALESQPDLQNKSIEELLAMLDRIPEAIRTTVRNNGGGHANHTMFWEMMAPGGAKEPGGELARGHQQHLRRIHRLQGTVLEGVHWPVRQRLGLAHRRPGWQARHREHAQSGHSAYGGEDAGARL